MPIRPDQSVARIMSWPVATIDHDATLAEAGEALAADSIGRPAGAPGTAAWWGSSPSETWSRTSRRALTCPTCSPVRRWRATS